MGGIKINAMMHSRKSVMYLLSICLAGSTLLIGATDSAPVPDHDAYLALIEGGITDDNAGRFDAASKKFEQAIAIKADRPRAYLNLGIARYKSGNKKGALESLLKGISAPAPHDADLFTFAAKMYDDNGEKTKAVDVLKKGLDENGNDANFYIDMCGGLLTRNEYKFARAGCQHAVLLDPENVRAHGLLGAVYGADLYQLPMTLSFARRLQLNPQDEGAASLRKALIFAFDHNNSEDHSDEGNYRETEKLMSITGTGVRAMLGRDADEGTILEVGYKALLETQIPMLSKQKLKGFTSTYYIPFFAALVENQLVTPFVNLILSGQKDGRFAKWLKDHPNDHARLEKFLKEYHWPKVGDATKLNH